MKQYRIVTTYSGYRVQVKRPDDRHWEYVSQEYLFLFMAKWKVRDLMSWDKHRAAVHGHKQTVVWGPHP